MSIYDTKASNKKLHTALKNAGYEVDENYEYGPKTEKAVKLFQSSNGLKITGGVDETTWGALDKYLTTPSGKNNNGNQNKSNNMEVGTGVIADEGKFNFNLNDDALYNQLKDEIIKSGKLASIDTMGRAQAMTGGYGNSFAESVGQQAYNEQLEGLDDVAMQLYTQAYNEYMDRETLKNSRYTNTVPDYSTIDGDDSFTPLTSTSDYLAVEKQFANITDETKAKDYAMSLITNGVPEDVVMQIYDNWKFGLKEKESELEVSTAKFRNKMESNMSNIESITGGKIDFDNADYSKGTYMAAFIYQALLNGDITSEEANYLYKYYSVTDQELSTAKKEGDYEFN